MIGLIPRDRWEHGLNDSLLALRAALRSEGPEPGIFIPGIGPSLPMKTGRAALVVAIKALGLRPGARVGVPLFCCPVVFEAVAAAGGSVRFIDIEPGTFCLSPEDLGSKRSEVDAVVAVHMFGHLCDMDRVREAAGDVPVIEDCAQALGSQRGGRPAGSWGEAAFFSFRSGKYVSAGEGGALYSCHPAINARALETVGAMPPPGRAIDTVHAAMVYMKSILRSRPLYGLVGHALWSAHGRRADLSNDRKMSLGRISRADLAIIRRRLPFLMSGIEQQRANASFFLENLKVERDMLVREKPGDFLNRCLFPMRLPSATVRDALAARLLHAGIDTMKYLDGIPRLAREHFGYEDDCPMADALSRQILIIPSYRGLGAGDLGRIVAAVNSSWKQVAGSTAVP